MKVRNVLLIDDDSTSNFISSRVLSRLGIVNELFIAMNGEEGLSRLDQNIQPDVIFVDLNMPVMDGFQFIEAFSKLDSALKGNARLVILTSSESIEDIRRAKKLGVDDYLVKPMKEADILRIFKNK